MNDGRRPREILSSYLDKAVLLDVRLPAPAARGAAGIARSQSSPPPTAGKYGGRPSLAEEIDELLSQGARRRRIKRRRRLLLQSALLAAMASMLILSWPAMRELLPARQIRLDAPAGGLRTRSLPFPAGRAAGLAILGGAYLALDPAAGEIVILDPGGRIAVRKPSFPVPSAAALSSGEDGLWSIDPAPAAGPSAAGTARAENLPRAASGWIRRHDPETFAVLEKHPAPSPGADGLLRDGGDLWIADRASSSIFRYAVSEGIRSASRMPIRPIGRVGGLARAGDHLWLLDADSRAIRRYRINGFSEDGEADLGGALPPEGKIVGLALEGRWVWVMTDSPPTLHRLSAARVRFHRRGLQGFFAFYY